MPGPSQFQLVTDAFSVMPAPTQAEAARRRTDVSDEQLSVSGVPTGGTRREPRSRRPLRPASVPLTDSEAAAPGPPLRPADGPGSAGRSRAAGSHMLGVQDVDDLGVRTDLVTACRI